MSTALAANRAANPEQHPHLTGVPMLRSTSLVACLQDGREQDTGQDLLPSPCLAEHLLKDTSEVCSPSRPRAHRHQNDLSCGERKRWCDILTSPSRKYEASPQLLVQTSPAKRSHLQMRHPLKIAGGVISPANCSMRSLYAIWKWILSMYQDVAQLSVPSLFNAVPPQQRDSSCLLIPGGSSVWGHDTIAWTPGLAKGSCALL